MPRKAVQAVQEPKIETDEELTRRYFLIDDWLSAENKRFDAHVAPHKHELEAIKAEFLNRLNQRGADSTKTDSGTAYKSTLLNVAVSPEGAPYVDPNSRAFPDTIVGEPKVGREAVLDFCLDYWDAIGNEMLIINVQKDAVKRWMEEHNGQPPPGVKISWFTRVNIRRS